MNVRLCFHWRTHKEESGDKLKVGYTTNDGDDVLDYFDLSGNGDRDRDFVNEDFGGSHDDAVDWWDDNFTTLLFGRHHNSWKSEEFVLPNNLPSIWVAFFMDNGDGDFAKIDNIIVKADPIPEPSTMALLLLGGLFLPRRR